MKISKNALEIIKHFEGFRAKPYLCQAGVPTIGYGATYYPDTGKKVSLTDPPITRERATEILEQQAKKYADYVEHYVKTELNQNQFDALTSFTFNVGPVNLQKSTLLKLVNINPNNKAIHRQFLRWVNADGRRSQGLVVRRTKEAILYFKPVSAS